MIKIIAARNPTLHHRIRFIRWKESLRKIMVRAYEKLKIQTPSKWWVYWAGATERTPKRTVDVKSSPAHSAIRPLGRCATRWITCAPIYPRDLSRVTAVARPTLSRAIAIDIWKKEFVPAASNAFKLGRKSPEDKIRKDQAGLLTPLIRSAKMSSEVSGYHYSQ